MLTIVRRGTLAVLLGLLVAGALAPVAAAHPISHPGAPRVRNLRPAFGEVLPAGAITVAAQVVSEVAITAHTLKVDGLPVPSRQEGDATHPTIAGDATLTAGDHVAELEVTGSDGRTGGRAWRFTLSDLPVRRIAGNDRVATAAAISRDQYAVPASAKAAVLARADDFADALTGASLARAEDGPVLLTDRAALATAARDELTRVLPPGSTVYLLGGTSALGSQVAADVSAAGFVPKRLSGATRFATATAVADELDPPAGSPVIVVNGFTFADALSGSAPSAARGMPILLTGRDTVPGETSSWLSGHSPSRVYVVGGEAAVSRAAADRLGTVTRVAGSDRYATSLAVAAAFFPAGTPLVFASGRTFPDALAGGPRAGALGAPLVLAPTTVVSDADAVAARQPSQAVLLGGTAALAESLAADLRRAVVDAGGPHPVSADPGPNAEIDAMDPITIGFDRDLDLGQANVYVTMNGEEVPGSLAPGDFPDTLVFTPAEVPVRPALGQAVDVRVVALAFDGAKWRHLDYRVTYRKLDMARGDTGAAVLELQQRLTSLGYWLGAADGNYGTLTSQAVMAFQKVHGLARTGTVDAATRNALAAPRRFAPRSAGDHLEVDKARQVLVVVRGGQPIFVFNTSTGTEKPYEYDGQTYLAHTPSGTFSVIREIDGIRESRLGTLYRPKYFTNDGVAVHGSASVPSYPASHGCVRLTNAATDFVWANNLLPIGSKVIVY